MARIVRALLIASVVLTGLRAEALTDILARMDQSARNFKTFTAKIKRTEYTKVLNDKDETEGARRLKRANGQTIGKKWLKIKVVRADGSPASLGRIFWLRNFVNGFLSLIPLYGIIDSLFIFSESRQCLHDKIADTIVVNA